MAERMSFIATIELDDLRGEGRELAEIIGIDAMRVVLATFGGTRVYVPEPAMARAAAVRYLVAHFQRNPDGTTNLRALARDIGIPHRVASQYLRSATSERQNCRR